MTAAPPRPVIEAGGGSDESMTASCHAPWTQNPDANDGNRCSADTQSGWLNDGNRSAESVRAHRVQSFDPECVAIDGWHARTTDVCITAIARPTR